MIQIYCQQGVQDTAVSVHERLLEKAKMRASESLQ